MRKRVFGEPVTARDVESLEGDSGGAHFVRLCAALIRKSFVVEGLPSVTLQVTERVSVPDGGVDAEVAVPAAAAVRESGGLVGPGATVFQFKFRDMASADRRHVVSALARRLREELATFKGGCQRYVLMTNVHLAGSEPRKLRDAIAEGLAGTLAVPPIVWGAAEIAAHLNVTADLRHLFLSEGGLSTVDIVEAELKASYARLGWPPFVGRADEVSAITSFLLDPLARLLRVAGRRYAGRTRLVIEALRGSGRAVVWASSPEDVSVDLLRDLDDAEDAVLVVDDCEGDRAARLLEWALQRRTLKTLVVETDDDAAGAATARNRLSVPPLSDDDARKLLGRVVPGLTFGQRSWIVEASAGLPGMLLHLGGIARDVVDAAASGDPSEFRQRLGALVEDAYTTKLSAEARRALQVAAVLPVLGIEGSVGRDVAAVAKALDTAPDILDTYLSALRRQGLIKRRGRFVEVVPPLLADHLVSEAVRDPHRVLAELAIASPERFSSFLERLARLSNETVRRALGELVAEWCADFGGLIRNAERLRVAAPAVPDIAIRSLERAIAEIPVERVRHQLTNEARRSVVWALEALALRSATFQRAARLLLALAEAENETYANSATGVFVSLFHWQHPEVPVGFTRRLHVLTEASRSVSERRRVIAADAGGAAFADHGVVALHHPAGPELPEPPHRAGTWSDLLPYAGGVVDLLRRLLGDDVPDVKERARQAFLHCVATIVDIGLRADAVEASRLVEQVLDTLSQLGRDAPTARSRTDVIQRVLFLRDRLTAHRMGQAAEDVIERVNGLERELSGESSLRDELWRWVGPPLWRQRGHYRKTAAEKLEELAGRLVDCDELAQHHLKWLVSDDAAAATELFRLLGQRDVQRRLLSRLVNLTTEPRWSERVSAYVAGWAQVDATGAASAVDGLIGSRPDIGAGLLHAACALPYDGSIVDRIDAIRRRVALAPAEFARELGWLLSADQLSSKDVECLVSRLDDGTPEVRSELLTLFVVRIARGASLSPRLEELAWTFLGTTFEVAVRRDRFDWDDLAAKLGERDPTRLLALLETALTVQTSRGTDRLSWHHELPLVWETLGRVDREGLLRLLLRLASRPNAPYQLDWTLEETIDPGRDRDLLLRFAREAGVEGARAVAMNLRPEKEGFWSVVRDLLVEGGADERVRERLLGALVTGGWSGSPSPMIRERLQHARALASDVDARVAEWAQEAVSLLEDWLRRAEREDEEDWIWDYRIRRSELEEMVCRAGSPERRWAVERLLKYAPPNRVIELLTPSEILEALPGLDQATRDRWEGWARVWSDRH